MVKRKPTRAKAKRKTRKTRARRSSLSPRKLSVSKPLNKVHGSAIKVLSRAVSAMDKHATKAAAIEAKLETASGNAELAIKRAASRKTAVAKRKAKSAKAQAAKVRVTLRGAQKKLRDANTAVKRATKVVVTELKREQAKQKAVAKFLSKWESAYDRKAGKKKRRVASVKKKRPRRRKAVR